MNNQKHVVYGTYKTRVELETAVTALEAAGFRASDLSVMIPHGESASQFVVRHTKAPEGAAAGAAIGAVIGGFMGWLSGAGMISVQGINLFTVPSPLIACLAGVGIMGLIGGIVGGLIGMVIPEYEAKQFDIYLEGIGLLLSVHSDDRHWAARAKMILNSTGAINIATTIDKEGILRATATERKTDRDEGALFL